MNVNKKPRKKSLKAIKKKAWKAFSEFIRQRGADAHGFNSCVTCGTKDHWRWLQAGHYIDGRTNTVLYDEKLVHAQCVHCNVFLNGNKNKYTIFMMKKYQLSPEQILELEDLRHKTRQMKYSDHEEVFNKYRQLVEAP